MVLRGEEMGGNPAEEGIGVLGAVEAGEAIKYVPRFLSLQASQVYIF